jgi:hypothetical protein
MTNYQKAKNALKEIADLAKRKKPLDKPAARQVINDCADMICKDLMLTEHQRNLLSDYACKLHP